MPSRARLSLVLLTAVAVLGPAASVATAAPPRPIFDAAHRAAPNVFAAPRPARIVPQKAAAAADGPGESCKTITFEGVADLAQIPDFDDISSPGWLGIIDGDAGGNGNFAFEPSPETVAFWLDNNPNRAITFGKPVSRITLFYADAYGITVTAYDKDNNVVDTKFGFDNYQGGGVDQDGHGIGDPTGDYNEWDPLELKSTDGNKIKKLVVSGAPNYAGIDDLKVCRQIRIDSAEMTQAIQEWQKLDDLKASLTANRTPPVPLVANKPGVLRVYFEDVDKATPVRVELSGVATATQNVTLQPGCTVDKARLQSGGCQSADLYFTPPQGNWTATVKTFDDQNREVESQDLNFKAQKTDKLVLKAVSVCDATDAAGNWQCGSAATLATLIGKLRKISPTDSVSVSTTSVQVRHKTSDFATMDGWWTQITKDIKDEYGLFDWAAGVLGTQNYYFGMIRPTIPGGTGGMAADIPSRGAASRTSATRLGVETNDEVVAHETGHMLGRKHTNTNVPVAGASPPGCYNLAADSTTDWPFADTRIQSAARREVGFDVATKTALDPANTFEIMSYCVPRWISPQTYRLEMPKFNPSGLRAHLQSVVVDDFWTVTGTVGTGGTVTLDPIYALNTAGPTDTGTGTWHIEVMNGANVVATRAFTPTGADTEQDSGELHAPPTFSELVPVTAGATGIRIKNNSAAQVASVTFGPHAPTASISAPAAGDNWAGPQTVQWTKADADGGTLTSWVQFSHDDGATWDTLGQHLAGTSLDIDADTLPGCTNTCRIRVLVSDGGRSVTATSGAFSIPRKLPSGGITGPADGTAVRPGDMVSLESVVTDVDDGVLDGAAVQWSSSRDGALGSGAVLPITSLSEGLHHITMTATDSDGHSVQDTVDVRVDGAAPVVALSATPDGTPASCVNVDLAASDTGGSGLQSEQYSLDGGTTYTDLPPGTALRFNVPGSGFMHVVARAIDGAGNLSAQDVRFFIATPCSDTTPPDTFINDGPDNGATITTPTATFAFDSDDSKATFECSLDGSAYFPCSSPATTPALVNGQHTASVRAIDVAGNSDPSPATRTFTVAVPPSGGGGGNGGGGTGGGGGGTGGTGGTPPGPSGPVGGTSKVPTTQLPQPGCPIAGTQLIGTARGDRRSGTSLSDIMFGRAGNDRLAGGSGNDCLYGEDGKDRLDGGPGDDRLLGGAGDDTLTDVAGTDRFDGGAGNDKINARDKARAGRKKADTVACGAGKKDVALVDKADRVAKDCEKVKRR